MENLKGLLKTRHLRRIILSWNRKIGCGDVAGSIRRRIEKNGGIL
jgi:hypothetical protein